MNSSPLGPEEKDGWPVGKKYQKDSGAERELDQESQDLIPGQLPTFRVTDV